MVASLSAFSMAFFTSVVLYLPALALEQVMPTMTCNSFQFFKTQITGLDVDSACIALFIICVFYTSVGGIKAVIWTDVFQLIFMFVSTGRYILSCHAQIKQGQIQFPVKTFPCTLPDQLNLAQHNLPHNPTRWWTWCSS